MAHCFTGQANNNSEDEGRFDQHGKEAEKGGRKARTNNSNLTEAHLTSDSYSYIYARISEGSAIDCLRAQQSSPPVKLLSRSNPLLMAISLLRGSARFREYSALGQSCLGLQPLVMLLSNSWAIPHGTYLSRVWQRTSQARSIVRNVPQLEFPARDDLCSCG